jgi:uncharacterized protein (DUF736 family)
MESRNNAREIPNLNIQSAKIVKRNFAGAAEDYNREGNRYFTIRIDDPNLAESLIADGWKLREGRKRNEDDDPRWFMDVKVAFNEYFPTKICTYLGKIKRELNESNVASLDSARIINADMTIRARYWEVNGKSGYKAYLKVLHATLEDDDPWADAYAGYDETSEN